MGLESGGAGANAGSPGPFEIGSAERRNRTDSPLAERERLKESREDGKRIGGVCGSKRGIGSRRSEGAAIVKNETQKEIKGERSA